jgi:hypothetical protein
VKENLAVALFLITILCVAVITACVSSTAMSWHREIAGMFTCDCGCDYIVLVQGDEVVVVPAPGEQPPSFDEGLPAPRGFDL